MKILMLAAENGALPGGKVGGIGDVIRDLPAALAAVGHRVTVLTPSYGRFAALPGTEQLAVLEAAFGGRRETLRLHRLAPIGDSPVENLVLDHPRFAAGGKGSIYHDDGDERPFATDASSFALFCSGAVSALLGRQLATPDVIHLHDWHAAPFALLRRFDPACAALRAIPTVYTIHNLALQGIRPLRDDPSSLDSWFPGLDCDLDELRDPRWAQCINLMRAGIRLSDRVHTVSPTYAREILREDDPEHGVHGGEGLEGDLREVDREGRLVGILNGCDYAQPPPRRPGHSTLLRQIDASLVAWIGRERLLRSAHHLAQRRVDAWLRQRKAPAPLVTSIGRLTPQKVSLLEVPLDEGRPALETMLEKLQPGRMIVLGSGDRRCEDAMLGIMSRSPNLLFLNGFSESLAAALYAAGDLFLMPSSFEPCGISQMQAMRAGQPCLVHGVGGLNDTVRHGHNGFVFRGRDPREQARHMVATFEMAVARYRDEPETWAQLVAQARSERFPWSDSVRQYERLLYGF